MMMPEHLVHLVRFQRSGGALSTVVAGKAAKAPSMSAKRLLLVGDDPAGEPGSLGPCGFDCEGLRAWLRAADAYRGVVGVFSGAPIPSAYAYLASGAQHLPSGAIIIECQGRTWLDWSRYVFRYAPRAIRYDVIPAERERSVRAQIIAEGGMPVAVA